MVRLHLDSDRLRVADIADIAKRAVVPVVDGLVRRRTRRVDHLVRLDVHHDTACRRARDLGHVHRMLRPKAADFAALQVGSACDKKE